MHQKEKKLATKRREATEATFKKATFKPNKRPNMRLMTVAMQGKVE